MSGIKHILFLEQSNKLQPDEILYTVIHKTHFPDSKLINEKTKGQVSKILKQIIYKKRKKRKKAAIQLI